jgi:hypothetical protein
MPKKRSYRRRTDEERISELEEKIKEIKQRQEVKKQRDDPVIREIPKIQRRLRTFAQSAMDHQRPDIANSTTAFVSSLDRFSRASRGASEDSLTRAPATPEN